MTVIKPSEVSNWKGRVVDVRNPDEFAAQRLVQAQCVPLGSLTAAVSGWDRNEPLLVMCKSGMRSKQAAQQLEANGFNQVYMLEGGLDACQRAGLQVVVDRKTIPVFRQVMVAAGLLLLVGLALSIFHPAFLLIDAFVAVGLTAAGLTGFCPMARVLEKMPWNQGATCTAKSCS